MWHSVRSRLAVRAVALIMVIAGAVTLGYGGLTWWWNVTQVREAQAAFSRAPVELPEHQSAKHGEPVARLHLPTLGLALGLALVVVEGDDDDSLLLGPGRMPATSAFGDGNTGIAGHRYPGVFWDLDKLDRGDPMVVETRETWFVYEVVSGVVVKAGNTGVLDPPHAGDPALLTLVTCDPRFSTARRLIRRGSLVRVTEQGAGPPAELRPNHGGQQAGPRHHLASRQGLGVSERALWVLLTRRLRSSGDVPI